MILRYALDSFLNLLKLDEYMSMINISRVVEVREYMSTIFKKFDFDYLDGFTICILKCHTAYNFLDHFCSCKVIYH